MAKRVAGLVGVLLLFVYAGAGNAGFAGEWMSAWAAVEAASKEMVAEAASAEAMLAAQEGYRAVTDRTKLESELQSRTMAVSSIECDFVQEKYLSVFSSKVVSTGKFYYAKDDKICMDYLTPAKYTMVLNGDKLKTVNAGKSTVVSLGGNPVMGRMRDLMAACMTGDLSRLDSSFSLEYLESDKEYKIIVAPESQAVASYLAKMEIILDKSDMTVLRLTMYENESDYTSYLFSSKKLNSKIDEEVFGIR